MNTTVIQNKIATSIKHETETNSLRHLLIDVATQNGGTMTVDAAQQVVNFVVHYVGMAPQYMEAGIQAAARINLEAEMKFMVGEIEQYWILENDLVPDHLGLIGILDDAYASMYLLQSLSEYCETHYHYKLVQEDLKQPNICAKGLLGIKVAEALESKVGVTMGRYLIAPQINRLIQNIFSSGFSFQNQFQAFRERQEVDDIVKARLGMIGIF